MTDIKLDKLEHTKRTFAKMAGELLAMDVYLKYKKDIMQCSSMDALEIIVKNMVTEVCNG